MKRTIAGVFLALFLAASFFGCRKDNPISLPPSTEGEAIVTLDFEFALHDNPFPGLNREYTDLTGRKVMITMLKFLLTDITLTGQYVPDQVLDDAILVNAGNTNTWTFAVPPGTYSGIRFNIGVPYALNHGDPAVFEDTAKYGVNHPLSYGNGMAWTWASGYRFVMFRAKYDSTSSMTGTSLDGRAEWDIGLDSLLRTMEFRSDGLLPLFKDGDATFIRVWINLDDWMYSGTDPLNLITDNWTHSAPYGSDEYLLARRIVNRYVRGITVEWL